MNEYEPSRCENCGNHSLRIFTVTRNGKSHLFDSFECAISRMAPRCFHCNTTIIGHGVEVEGSIYCCSHCAESKFEEETSIDHLLVESGR